VASMVQLMVDEYGYLVGGEDLFPVDTTDHDWDWPYPPYNGDAKFSWRRGELATHPSFFRHPEIRDWVCDETAISILLDEAPHDIHVIGHGSLDGKKLTVVQATTILDIVDRESSIVDKYPSYEVLRFPVFRRGSKEVIESRVFRVPGSYIDVFMGKHIQSALEDAGLTGLRFAPVDFADV
jgi:hypothetical protein